MAQVDAWMPLYIGDYLRDTGDLSTEEHGAYFLLIMAGWETGGVFPNEPSKLARMARVTIGRWPAIWEALERFFTVEGDGLVQKRLQREREQAENKKERAVTRGRKGAAARYSSSNRHGVEQAENKQTLSTSGPLLEHQPLRGDGEDRSGSGSVPDPLSVSGSQGEEPARNPAIWGPSKWRDMYGRAWTKKYQSFYGMSSDGPACGKLADLLDRTPVAEILAAQDGCERMFSEFLSSASPKTVEAKHPFFFFVTAFGGLKVNGHRQRPAGPVYRRLTPP